jgi:hypothetical protein
VCKTKLKELVSQPSAQNNYFFAIHFENPEILTHLKFAVLASEKNDLSKDKSPLELNSRSASTKDLEMIIVDFSGSM